MKIINTLTVICFVTLVASTAVYAESFQCVGLDGSGTKINVLYDDATSTVNVNGKILKIESGTQDENGVATEDFLNSDGEKTYVSLVVEGKDKIILRQFRSSDDEELVVVPLACE